MSHVLTHEETDDNTIDPSRPIVRKICLQAEHVHQWHRHTLLMCETLLHVVSMPATLSFHESRMTKEMNANAKYDVAAHVRVSPSGPGKIDAAPPQTKRRRAITEREYSEVDTE